MSWNSRRRCVPFWCGILADLTECIDSWGGSIEINYYLNGGGGGANNLLASPYFPHFDRSVACSYSAASVMSYSWSRGLQPARLLCLCGFPGKKTGVGCHFLLHGIFPTVGWNPCLLQWQADSLPWVTWEASDKSLPLSKCNQLIPNFSILCRYFSVNKLRSWWLWAPILLLSRKSRPLWGAVSRNFGSPWGFIQVSSIQGADYGQLTPASGSHCPLMHSVPWNFPEESPPQCRGYTLFPTSNWEEIITWQSFLKSPIMAK